MGLRDALMQPGEPGELVPDYLDRAIALAKQQGGSGRLRLEVGPAFSFGGESDVRAGSTLWVERGSGRTESWQKVTPLLYGSDYNEVMAPWIAAFERAHG